MENSLLLPPQNPGQSSTLSRIHETSAKFQRYKILLRRRWWFLLLTASIGVCIMALRITSKPDTYQSLAKLVAGGRIVAQEGNVGWQEQLTDFYGTIIETLEYFHLKNGIAHPLFITHHLPLQPFRVYRNHVINKHPSLQ